MRACGYASRHSLHDDTWQSAVVMPRYDVSAWECALDLTVQEVELSAVPQLSGTWRPRQTSRTRDVIVGHGIR